MSPWIVYAVIAAVLYGLHQVFTKLAAGHAASLPGALLVEGSAALALTLVLLGARLFSHPVGSANAKGIAYAALTGICVAGGTVAFFASFQHGGPLSAVPIVLAAGTGLMAIVGFVALGEPFTWPRALGVALSLAALVLLSWSERPR
jgi:transporter family protein